MKLNLFNKKPLGKHFDKLRADYAETGRKLDSARQELTRAEEDLRTKEQSYQQELARSSLSSSRFSSTEKELLAARNHAKQYLLDIESGLADLQSQHTALRRLAEAPAKMDQARETYQRLAEQRKSLQGELDKTGTASEKLGKRISVLEQRIVAETKSAALALADAEGELVMPEGFGNLDAELRVTRAALAELKERAEGITTELQIMREQSDEARNTFVGHRTVVAELELAEQLPAFVEIIARAAVARHLSHPSHSPDKYTVEIPRAVVDAAYESLNAELSA